MKRPLVFVACILGVAASAASADDLAAASMSGSDRLLNFVATQEANKGTSFDALQKFVSSSVKLGFNVTDPNESSKGFRRSLVSIQPLMMYDPNVNGGNAKDRIDLGNGNAIVFAPESLAVGSFVGGASLNFGTDFVYDRGRYFDFKASASKKFSLGDDFTQEAWSISLCSKNHLDDWVFLDLCGSRNFSAKELSDSYSNRVEYGLTYLTDALGVPSEIRLINFRQDSSGSWNDGAGVALTTLVGGRAALTIGAEAEFVRDDAPFTAYDVHVGLQTMAFGRPVGVQLSRSLQANSYLLGRRHDDVTTGIALNLRATNRIGLQLSYNITDSDISFYDKRSIGVSVSFSGFDKRIR